MRTAPQSWNRKTVSLFALSTVNVVNAYLDSSETLNNMVCACVCMYAKRLHFFTSFTEEHICVIIMRKLISVVMEFRLKYMIFLSFEFSSELCLNFL